MGPEFAFWKPSPAVKLAPPAIYLELRYGEDVEGLIDLPVKEILDELKAAFPTHEEKPGALRASGATGGFETTWSWQYVGVKTNHMVSADIEQLKRIFAGRGCGVFDVAAGTWTEAAG